MRTHKWFAGIIHGLHFGMSVHVSFVSRLLPEHYFTEWAFDGNFIGWILVDVIVMLLFTQLFVYGESVEMIRPCLAATTF